MPAQRRFGMDHPHYPWLPLPKRPPLRWPEGAQVALCVVVNLEHMEWMPSEGSYWSSGPCPGASATGLFRTTLGSRIESTGIGWGFFGCLDALEAAGIRPTIAMDLLTAQNYPFLVEHCLGRGAEIIAHGVSVTRMITEKMGESEEREYIAKCLEGMREATGTTPQGVVGAGVRRIVEDAATAGGGGGGVRVRLDERRAALRDDDAHRVSGFAAHLP